MVSDYARQALRHLINRQVTPSLSFRDYPGRVHCLPDKEDRDRSSAMAGGRTQRTTVNHARSIPMNDGSSEAASSGQTRGVNSSTALEHAEAPRILEEFDRGVAILVDWDWERDRDGRKVGKTYCVSWKSSELDERYIVSRQYAKSYVLVGPGRKRWHIESMTKSRRPRTVRITWQASWIPAEDTRLGPELFKDIEECRLRPEYRMLSHEVDEFASDNQHVYIHPGRDLYPAIRRQLINFTQHGKGKHLLDKEQRRVVLPHYPFFDPGPVLKKLDLAKGKCQSALVQGVGERAMQPCQSCNDGKGVFIGCVVLNGWFNGACACCRYSNKSTSCELHKNNQRDQQLPARNTLPRRRATSGIEYVASSSVDSFVDEAASSEVSETETTASSLVTHSEIVVRPARARSRSWRDRGSDELDCPQSSNLVDEQVSTTNQLPPQATRVSRDIPLSARQTSTASRDAALSTTQPSAPRLIAVNETARQNVLGAKHRAVIASSSAQNSRPCKDAHNVSLRHDTPLSICNDRSLSNDDLAMEYALAEALFAEDNPRTTLPYMSHGHEQNSTRNARCAAHSSITAHKRKWDDLELVMPCLKRSQTAASQRRHRQTSENLYSVSTRSESSGIKSGTLNKGSSSIWIDLTQEPDS